MNHYIGIAAWNRALVTFRVVLLIDSTCGCMWFEIYVVCISKPVHGKRYKLFWKYLNHLLISDLLKIPLFFCKIIRLGINYNIKKNIENTSNRIFKYV